MEQERFAQLYSELYARVSAYALHRAPPDLAAEAVDEAFLIAWRKRDRLPAGRELPWLLVTTGNVLANHRRRRAHQDALGVELARLAAGEVAGGAEQVVLERVTVLAALAELSEREREALMLTEWDGLSGRDAARVAGCSVTAFAVRLHRARRRFADGLARWDTVAAAVQDGATVMAAGKEAR
ncbi:RNA polymerase sigma factor [Amycolatopsis sp. 195334CR]|uniref:RNA polymerase sigma factor n=1 Tax=Amycolatopsis sp. 195334CR TaxID=2814588 RepID=UPI001A8F9F54|nr:RNA polymerase sigma factor [Amycolatopsis sp. 195334CR]MBN6034055.1 RNA polymerase sigma factor [Amycolatopsis sp. 195334CR]